MSFFAKHNMQFDDDIKYVLGWVEQTGRIKVWYDPVGNVKAVIWWVNVSDVDAETIISNQTISHLRPWYFDSGPNIVAFVLTSHDNCFWIKTWLRWVLFRDVTLLIKHVEREVPERYEVRKLHNTYAKVSK